MSNERIELLSVKRKRYDEFEILDANKDKFGYQEISDLNDNVKTPKVLSSSSSIFKSLSFKQANFSFKRVKINNLKSIEQFEKFILLKIFSFLGEQDLASLAKTCKYFKEISGRNSLWRPIAQKAGLNTNGIENIKLAYRNSKFSEISKKLKIKYPDLNLKEEIELKRDDNNLFGLFHLSIAILFLQALIVGAILLAHLIKYNDLKESSTFWTVLALCLVVDLTLCFCGSYKSVRTYMENVDIVFKNEEIAKENREILFKAGFFSSELEIVVESSPLLTSVTNKYGSFNQ